MPAEAAAANSDSRLNVKIGDEVMVQVTKSPMGTKGARLSMNVSFVGKNLIYLPATPFWAFRARSARKRSANAFWNARKNSLSRAAG